MLNYYGGDENAYGVIQSLSAFIVPLPSCHALLIIFLVHHRHEEGTSKGCSQEERDSAHPSCPSVRHGFMKQRIGKSYYSIGYVAMKAMKTGRQNQTLPTGDPVTNTRVTKKFREGSP